MLRAGSPTRTLRRSQLCSSRPPMPFPLMVSVRSFASTVGLTVQIIVLFDRLKPGAHQNLASLPDFARARSGLQTLSAITGQYGGIKPNLIY